ncbi:uncharacterized protein YdcI [Anthonomus grandis grandis]|uniref:uncharacterized protein YdcI n=1 Tax=Anthonomus grandis grandis TaxID=2921223 RepID=UPI002165A539|nr:uncharacterized protein YdcI [Anthonomus grandis grandis]
MAKDDFLSSDDDQEHKPVARKRPTRNTKQVVYRAELTSDSDSEESRDQTFNGEVSLVSSDDEYQPEVKKPRRKAALTKQKGKIAKTKAPEAPVDLLTSDEEPIVKPQTVNKKRKLTDMGNIFVKTPPKKAKTTTAPKKQSKPPSPGPSKSSFIESDVSLDISMQDIQPAWDDAELLAEKSMIDEEVARNLIKLWEEGNTIPFIARYRKHVIGTMGPEELRTTKETFDEICTLKKKMCTVIKAVAQTKKLDNKLQKNICAVRTLEELEHIYAPFKGDPKRSLVERARNAGLEEPALAVLNNTNRIKLEKYVKPEVKEVKTTEEVEKGIVYILASEMSTDPELLAHLRHLRKYTKIRLQTKKARQTKPAPPKQDPQKFEHYFEFDQRVDWLKPHQVMAINRGEALKVLSVKLDVPDDFQQRFVTFCRKKWAPKSDQSERDKLISMAIEHAYVKIVSPLIEREIRAELKQKAEKESCKVFSDNLKHLLLIPPMKGEPILGIDPGYANGCKLALISHTGSLLAQNVVYPHHKRGGGHRGEHVIKEMLLKHRCNLICIGNGTACRQTEEWISELIREDFFLPLRDVQYTIVNEDGASIYSCSPEAKKEFGALDPNIISAVSLARRIQDPMAELVKVEPCHLGVGMYQLDIKKKQLEEALGEVVSECVSFVGVDLNTASQCLLRRVAGLSDKRASQIIEHRERHGPFTHRAELLKVYGIGERVFEQCAGFLRVGPTDPEDVHFYQRNKSTTPLDATVIHPESYSVVRRLLAKMKLKESEIGTDRFITNFKRSLSALKRDELVDALKSDPQTIQLILDALAKELNHDLRAEVSGTPLFKKGVTTMADLCPGDILTGRVKNVTSFGAFVDCGVERDGLIHVKFMNGLSLHLGDVVEVKVGKVDLGKGHIQLEAVRKI